MRIGLLFHRFRPGWVMVAALVANVIHPFIHGTPLDMGALDHCITALDAAVLACPEEA